MLTTFYPPHSFGGDAVGVQRFARALVRRGHHVTVIHDVDAFNALHPGPEPRVDSDTDQGVEVVRLRSGMGMLSPLLTQQTGRPVVNGHRIDRILKQGRFDVVNFHNVSLLGGPGLLSRGEDAVRLYMAHEHWLICPMHVLWKDRRERCEEPSCLKCTLLYHRPPQVWRWTGYLEREMRHMDAVIAMSEFSRRMHRDRGFPMDMEVLSYFLPDPAPGVDRHNPPAPTGPRPHERPYFFFAGRLELIKGLQDVIPAFAGEGDTDLVVAGDGEYATALRTMAKGMPRVRFLGRIPLDDLSVYYRHAIATLVPSVCYETFGIVLIEAFREGTPVIARRLGPFPEIVDRSGGGELFENSEQLLSSMRRIQQQPGYRAQLSVAGYRAYIRYWTESAVIPEYLEIVHRAAVRRGHAGVLAAMDGTGRAQ